MSEVTHILQEVDYEEPRRAAELLPEVYAELRRLAESRMASQPAGHTLQATELVHEAYTKLVANGDRTWRNRQHFFATAAAAMRHILVDHARRKAAVRHGGGQRALNLDEVVIASETADEGVLLVDETLSALQLHDPQAAELVNLRFFAGFTLVEAADLLGMSERSAKRLWAYARAWLFQRLRPEM